MIIYRLVAFAIWFGAMFAVCTVVIAVALVLIVGAVLVGLAMPSRTIGGQLRSLYANADAAVAHVRALGSP